MAGPTAVDIHHAFGLKPEDALKYLRGKGLRSAAADHWNWWDTFEDANDRAFVVSKLTRHRLLSQTRQIVANVLEEGGTLQVAAGELENAYRKAGWWGTQTIVDQTGGAEVVRLGSMHRIKTILRTNMQTAYAAGRWHRQRETIEARPYWQYIAIDDGSTRQSHRRLNGLVFRADDPIWEKIYPPNGFNCRCRVRALTDREVRRLGLKVIESPKIRSVTDRIGLDKRTGEDIRRPGARISWADPATGENRSFRPDPGWSYNPGRGSLAWSPPQAGAKAVPGLRTWIDEGRPPAADLPRADPPPLLPRAKTQHEALVTLESALGIDDANPRRRIRTPVGEDVLLRQGRLDHVVQKFGDHRERYANRIIPTLVEPDEVWRTEYDDGTFRKRYIKVFSGRGRHALSVVTDMDATVLYNFIAPMDNNAINKQRKGALLYPTD